MATGFGLSAVGSLEPAANTFWSNKGLNYWTSELNQPGAPTISANRQRTYTFLWTRNIENMHPQIPLKFRVRFIDNRVYRDLEWIDEDGMVAPERRTSMVTANGQFLVSTGIQKSERNVIGDVGNLVRALTIWKVDHYQFAHTQFFSWYRMQQRAIPGDGTGAAMDTPIFGLSGHLPNISDAKWANKWIDIPHEPIMAGNQMVLSLELSYFIDPSAKDFKLAFQWDTDAGPPDISVGIDLITKDKPMSNETRWWFTKRLNQGSPVLNLFKLGQF